LRGDVFYEEVVAPFQLLDVQDAALEHGLKCLGVFQAVVAVVLPHNGACGDAGALLSRHWIAD
jgi:hypothetical protein